ncbi:MAG TPA: hypothetical protein EYG99_00490 [Candidatus Pacebacteria bacterium]|nr:hypothetical protein [Candidatus Paceibacterota bacterium]
MKKIVLIIAVATIPLITLVGVLYFGVIYFSDDVKKDTICANVGETTGSCVGCAVKCCEGLKSLNHFIVKGECINYVVDGQGLLCSDCGNGICDKDYGEDYCNCPEDCERNKVVEKKECISDEDCVPATCCHATETVNKDSAPNCDGMMCTMSCETILDCGRGKPICNNGVCEIEIK